MKKLKFSIAIIGVLCSTTTALHAAQPAPPGMVYLEGNDSSTPNVGHVRIVGSFPINISGTTVGSIEYDCPYTCHIDKKGELVFKGEQHPEDCIDLRLNPQAILKLNKTIVLPGSRGSYNIPYHVWFKALSAARKEFTTLFKKIPFAFAEGVYSRTGTYIDLKSKPTMMAMVQARIDVAIISQLSHEIRSDRFGTPNYSKYTSHDARALRDTVLTPIIADKTKITNSTYNRASAYSQFKDLKLHSNPTKCDFRKEAQQYADTFRTHAAESYNAQKSNF